MKTYAAQPSEHVSNVYVDFNKENH